MHTRIHTDIAQFHRTHTDESYRYICTVGNSIAHTHTQQSAIPSHTHTHNSRQFHRTHTHTSYRYICAVGNCIAHAHTQHTHTVYINMYRHTDDLIGTSIYTHTYPKKDYGVALVSRIDTIIVRFCKRDL